MKKYETKFTIEKMRNVFKVSRSGYYDWLNRKPSKRSVENFKILNGIKEIYELSGKTYGSPRITQELKFKGFEVSRPRIARLMKKENIRSIVKKKYVVTTNSNHEYEFSANLLDRKFKVSEPGKYWVSDITYIRTKEGWLYLTTVIDLFDRKVLGWAMSSGMKAIETTIPSLKMALNNRSTKEQLLYHSDRGIQYSCDEFRKLLKKNDITQSMSRKGNCWDNAVAESFFKTIKSERIYHRNYLTRESAKSDIFNYIEVWYNRKRRHSTLGYLTPLEMEQFYLKKLAA